MKIKVHIAFLLSLLLFSCSEKIQNLGMNSDSKKSDSKPLDSIIDFKLSEKQASEINIKTQLLELSYPEVIIEADAEIRPSDEAIYIVSSPISGKVSKLYVKEGSSIEKGSILAEIESMEFARLLADYIKADALVQYYKAEEKTSTALVGNETRIAPEITQMNLDKSKAELNASLILLSTLGLSENEINSYKNNKNAKATLKLRAEISGNINQKLIELGQPLSSLQELFTIVNKNLVIARVVLSQQDAHYAKIGNEAELLINGDKIKAKIQSINPKIDDNNRNFIANLYSNELNAKYLIGSKAKLSIKTKSEDAVLAIPLEAITYEGETAIVYCKKDKINYQKRIIDIKRISGKTAILNSGLSAGEEIAINEIYSLQGIFLKQKK